MGLLDSVKRGMERKEQGFGYSAAAEYLGGHPAIVKAAHGNIYTTEEGLRFKPVFGKELVVPYQEIIKIESDTSERLGLGRLIAFGVLAFAMKKKDKFLSVTCRDNTGMEFSFAFGKLNADEWKGIILKARQSSLG